jgi:hypothetical protein
MRVSLPVHQRNPDFYQVFMGDTLFNEDISLWDVGSATSLAVS